MRFRTSIAIAFSSLLAISAAGTVAAAGTTEGAIIIAASKKQTTTYSQTVIDQARRANDTRSGDPEWDECMKKEKGDFIETLGNCFCLLTPGADCGKDDSGPG